MLLLPLLVLAMINNITNASHLTRNTGF